MTILATIKVYYNGSSYEGANVTNSRNSDTVKSDKKGIANLELEEGGTVGIYVNGTQVFNDYPYKFTKGYDYESGLIVKL